MQKLFLLLVTCLITYTGFSQEDIDTVPPYLRSKRIPEFKIIQPGGKQFTQKDIPAGKPVVIIYFSPDCGHCKIEAEEIVKAKDSLQHAIFIWVSYKNPKDIAEFYTFTGLNKLSNQIIGRDPDYVVPSFFRVRFTPFVAVYDANGKYMKAYEGGVEIPELVQLLDQFK
jgi:thiol-disulfide isomerase/thioredoxin